MFVIFLTVKLTIILIQAAADNFLIMKHIRCPGKTLNSASSTPDHVRPGEHPVKCCQIPTILYPDVLKASSGYFKSSKF